MSTNHASNSSVTTDIFLSVHCANEEVVTLSREQAILFPTIWNRFKVHSKNRRGQDKYIIRCPSIEARLLSFLRDKIVKYQTMPFTVDREIFELGNKDYRKIHEMRIYLGVSFGHIPVERELGESLEDFTARLVMREREDSILK
ncbi:hypothetical protein L596_000389 [Steinernema carpocapsae]|uniref:Uncharacterized protein n=1 Tax=Steinernema carpocapsae TaxID=34508 RepID=A0A4U8UJE1_STECR|nr:hypothetical protein L596_000389 [Steinernema carpocapsae]